MNMVRLAVVGGGHLGRIHTRLAADLPNTRLVAVVEPDRATGNRLMEEFGCRVVADVSEIAGQFDALTRSSKPHRCKDATPACQIQCVEMVSFGNLALSTSNTR